MFLVFYLLISKSMMDKRNRANHMDILLKRVTPPQEEPEGAPSEGVPEEGIAVIGDGSSMCVLAPDGLPVG